MLARRRFLGLLAATPLMAAASTLLAGEADMVLWPDGPPGGGGPSGPEQRTSHGAVSRVSLPRLRIIRPKTPNGGAVLIAGGGGYRRIMDGSEARPAAAWFVARGFTAFVLTYRLPGEGWGAGPKAPLQDATRAMRLIRSRADEFGLDRTRIGAVGFSAGGHLIGMLATDAFDPLYPPADPADAEPARPDFAVLSYPVVTLKPPYDRTSTRKMLVGQHPNEEESSAWSVETHVRPGDPPFFLVQAKDDPISDPQNTVILADALRSVGVPVELLQLPAGRHGFGMGSPGSPTAEWPNALERWLRVRNLLG